MNLKKTLSIGLRHRLYGRDDNQRRLELAQVGCNDDPVQGREYIYHILDADSGEQLGRMELRLGHDPSIEFLGNVGYSVLPQYRGCHYAARACRLLAREARELGMDYLTITCDTDNTASRKTIESLGAQYLGLLKRQVHINASHVYTHEKHNYRWELDETNVDPADIGAATADAKGETHDKI